MSQSKHQSKRGIGTPQQGESSIPCRLIRHFRPLIHGITWVLAFSIGLASAIAAPDVSRLRVLVETDAGGDPDDEQSMVRFLLYVNEWDVEGIIANRAQTRAGENRSPERTGLGVVQRLVKAYGACWTNLVQHDARYPEAPALLARTVAGYDEVDDAVKLIIATVDRDDPRPVWYMDWGSDHGSATNNLHRALDRVWRQRGADGYARYKDRLRYIGYDRILGEHARRAPAWRLWVNTFQPEIDRRRWYHRFSAITATAGGFNLERDMLQGHGPLGALYPTNTTHWQKEGDSMTFLYLIPTGMNDPNEPTWGSWAGRHGLNPEYADQHCYWANQADMWNGTTNRDNVLSRWAADLQNDFRARLNWCVQPASKANHPPRPIVNGVTGTEVLRWQVKPGARVTLDASASTDPDGGELQFTWFQYSEAGTYRGSLSLQDTNQPAVSLTIPSDANGTSLHLLVNVTDAGSPPLARYRRVVLDVEDAASAWSRLGRYFTPPPEYSGRLGSFGSPLLMPDGTTIETSRAWKRQRARLLNEWHKLMGPWPPVIERPDLKILSATKRDNFSQQRVRLEIGAGQTGEGWLLTPEGNGPFPAVLVVYYEPETSVGLNPRQPLRDFGLQLARRGFVTLSIGSPGGNAWKPETGTAVCQPLSFHAYVAANCWQALARLPAVDARRIGVVGHSYGGKWAMFAGALWDQFAAVAVSDPGIVFDESRPNVNYWEPWYLGLDPAKPRPKTGVPTAENPRTGAYERMIVRGHDLHELHALIAPRPFLVSGGAEDPPSRWIALNHTVAVNRILGATNRVALTSRQGHDPTEESNAQLYAFFEHFLAGNGAGRTPR